MTDAEPNRLIEDIVENIDYPHAEAAQAATDQLAGAVGNSLGRLAELAIWAAGAQGNCPPHRFERSRLVLFAGDHGIAAAGDLAEPATSTAGQLAELAAGRGPLTAFAEAAGVGIRLVDLAVDAGQDQVDALGLDEVRAAIAKGIAIADDEIDAGAELLIVAELGAGNRTVAATLISVLTDTEPIKVAGQPGELDDARWIRNCAAIRDARRRAWPHRTEPAELLAIAGSAELAAMTGFLLQAARRRTPVLLDGLVVSAAALVAQLASPRVVRWFQPAHRSPEPAHELALRRLGLSPIVELDIWHGQGLGALLVLPILRSATLVLTEPPAADLPAVTDLPAGTDSPADADPAVTGSADV